MTTTQENTGNAGGAAATDTTVTEGAVVDTATTTEDGVTADIAVDTQTTETAQADTVVTPDFPDDWREKISAGDEKMLEKLKRYGSPKAVAEALAQVQEKISKGEFKRPLADDATDEQKAEWRKENGIPDTFEGYELKLGDGYVVGDAEKPMINEFLKAMHEDNTLPAVVNKALTTYYKLVEQEKAALDTVDNSRYAETEKTLKQEWGRDYDTNKSLVMQHIENILPADQVDNFLSGRLANGELIENSPAVLRALLGAALQINPGATLVSGEGERGHTQITDEIAGYEKMLRENPTEYWKGPKAEQHQERYRNLLSAKAKLDAKA